MRTTLLLLLSLAAFWPAEEAFAQRELDAMQLSTGEGVVVLKNGRTLHGDVSRLGDQLLIRLAAGGEIRIPFAQSVVIAESLEEAYEIRRDALQPSAVDDRAKLIEWCLQEDLLHRAADQILALSKIDPRHPKLPQLERRLQARAKMSSSPAVAPSTPAAVMHASALEVAPPLAPTVDPRTFFAEKVQAQIVFGCAAAKCHGGPAGKGFQLRPYPIAVRPVDEITDANFAAVKEFLGDGGPKSPARSYATRAHAGPTGEKVNELLAQLARHFGDLPTGGSETGASDAASLGGSAVRTAGFAAGDASPPVETNPYDPAPFNLRYHGRAADSAMP